MRGPASAAELLDVLRVLLLVQAGILVANTIEAGLFGIAFSGGLTPTALVTGAAALVLFVARGRVDASLRGRRAIVIVESVIVATFGLDVALALVLTHQAVPLMAILTRFALPVCVITLLGATARASRPAATDLGAAS